MIVERAIRKLKHESTARRREHERSVGVRLADGSGSWKIERVCGINIFILYPRWSEFILFLYIEKGLLNIYRENFKII